MRASRAVSASCFEASDIISSQLLCADADDLEAFDGLFNII
jgi:hypothetical protein